MSAQKSDRILGRVFTTAVVATAVHAYMRGSVQKSRKVTSAASIRESSEHINNPSSDQDDKLMDDLSVAAFEQRAAEAETRLAFLQMKLASSESQRSLVTQEDLLSIRQALVEAKAEAQKLQTEKDKDASEIAKLRYQVLHLKRTCQELTK